MPVVSLEDWKPAEPAASSSGQIVPLDDWTPAAPSVAPTTPGNGPALPQDATSPKKGLNALGRATDAVIEAWNPVGEFIGETVNEVGAALGRGALDVVQAVSGTAPEMLGQFGADRLDALGESLRPGTGDTSKLPQYTPNFEGNAELVKRALAPVKEAPSLQATPALRNATYTGLLAENDYSTFFRKAVMETAEMGPQLALAAVAASMAGPLGAGATGALVEGASAYQSATEAGMRPDEALSRSGAFGAMVGVLNAIPFAKGLTQPIRRVAPNGGIMADVAEQGLASVMEGVTEIAEGPAEELAFAEEIPRSPEALAQIVLDMAEATKQESGVFVPAVLSRILVSPIAVKESRRERILKRIRDRFEQEDTPTFGQNPFADNDPIDVEEAADAEVLAQAQTEQEAVAAVQPVQAPIQEPMAVEPQQPVAPGVPPEQGGATPVTVTEPVPTAPVSPTPVPTVQESLTVPEAQGEPVVAGEATSEIEAVTPLDDDLAKKQREADRLFEEIDRLEEGGRKETKKSKSLRKKLDQLEREIDEESLRRQGAETPQDAPEAPISTEPEPVPTETGNVAPEPAEPPLRLPEDLTPEQAQVLPKVKEQVKPALYTPDYYGQMTDQEFASTYINNFKTMMQYTPDQVGSGIYLERMAAMEEAKPELVGELETLMADAEQRFEKAVQEHQDEKATTPLPTLAEFEKQVLDERFGASTQQRAKRVAEAGARSMAEAQAAFTEMLESQPSPAKKTLHKKKPELDLGKIPTNVELAIVAINRGRSLHAMEQLRPWAERGEFTPNEETQRTYDKAKSIAEENGWDWGTIEEHIRKRHVLDDDWLDSREAQEKSDLLRFAEQRQEAERKQQEFFAKNDEVIRERREQEQKSIDEARQKKERKAQERATAFADQKKREAQEKANSIDGLASALAPEAIRAYKDGNKRTRSSLVAQVYAAMPEKQRLPAEWIHEAFQKKIDETKKTLRKKKEVPLPAAPEPPAPKTEKIVIPPNAELTEFRKYYRKHKIKVPKGNTFEDVGLYPGVKDTYFRRNSGRSADLVLDEAIERGLLPRGASYNDLNDILRGPSGTTHELPIEETAPQVVYSPEAQSIIDQYGSVERAMEVLKGQRVVRQQEGKSTKLMDAVLTELENPAQQSELFAGDEVLSQEPERGPGGLFDQQTTLGNIEQRREREPGEDDDIETLSAFGSVLRQIEEEAQLAEEEEFLFGGVGAVMPQRRQRAKGVSKAARDAAEEAARLEESKKNDYKDPDPEKEVRMERASGLTKVRLRERIKHAALDAYHNFTRAQKHIPNNQEFSVANELFRFLKETGSRASDEVNTALAAVLDPMTEADYKVFSRYLFFRNLEDSMVNHGENQDGRQGYTLQEVRQRVAHYGNIINQPHYTAVRTAIKNRQRLVKYMQKELEDYGLLPDGVAREWYWHHQVKEYQDGNTRVRSLNTPRPKKRGFQRGRSKSDLQDEAMDVNIDYLQSEAEWMLEAAVELRKEKWLRRLDQEYGIPIKDIQKEAERRNRAMMIERGLLAPEEKTTNKAMSVLLDKDFVSWADVLRELYPNHGAWQPREGNAFFRAMTLNEKMAAEMVGDALAGAVVDLEDYGVQALVMGKKLRTLILPVEIVRELNDMKAGKTSKLGDLERAVMQSWKQYILTAPHRIAGYTLRNLTGDLDPVVATDPGILRYLPQAMKDLASHYRGDLDRPQDVRQAIELAAIGSGRSEVELTSLQQMPLFEEYYRNQQSTLEKMTPWAMYEAYFKQASGLNAARENLFRYAAYLYFKDALSKGKLISYGGSKPEVVNALKKRMGTEVAAAHLSRNLLGDYNNLSVAGTWMRNHLMPFYSWMEINTSRTARIMRNSWHEAKERVVLVDKDGRPVNPDTFRESATRAVGKAVFTANALLRMFRLMAMFWLYNRLFHGDKEEQLSKAEQRTPHLILGENELGETRIFRRVGALNDVLQQFGITDILAHWDGFENGQLGLKDAMLFAGGAMAATGFGGLRPEFNTILGGVSGLSLYPDPREPRLQDRGEAVAGLFGMRPTYQLWKGQPVPNYFEKQFMGTVFMHPGRQAMTDAYDTRNAFLTFIGKKRRGTFEPNPDLRQMKLAYYANRYDLFREAKSKYVESGGDEQGFNQSMRTMSPIQGIPEEFREPFMRWMTPKQLERWNEAMAFSQGAAEAMTEWWARSE